MAIGYEIWLKLTFQIVFDGDDEEGSRWRLKKVQDDIADYVRRRFPACQNSREIADRMANAVVMTAVNHPEYLNLDAPIWGQLTRAARALCSRVHRDAKKAARAKKCGQSVGHEE